MSLVASLNVGVSALRSFSEGIQVISNNISNVSTVAYKSSHANYSDTFSNLLRPLVPGEGENVAAIDPTQIGGGVQVQSVTARFTQGTISNTGSSADLAIAGPGYFRVKDPATQREYVTRAGNFRFDATGYLVTQQGYRVQGTAGASTMVAYNPGTGDYSVKSASSNPVQAKAYRFGSDPNILQNVTNADNVEVGMVVYSSSSLKTFSGSTQKGSNTVTLQLGSADLSKLKIGQAISGTGIPAGAYILGFGTVGTVSDGTVKDVVISQSAFATSTSGTYSIPSWTSGDPQNLGNNHAVVTAKSGTSITLSNMDGFAKDVPLSLTFMRPSVQRMSVSDLKPVMVPAGTTTANTVGNQTAFTANGLAGDLTGGVLKIGSFDAIIPAADAANLKVGMTVDTGGAFDSNGVKATVVDIVTTTDVTKRKITFSNPYTTAGAAATGTIASAYYVGLTGDTLAVDLSLTGVDAAGTGSAGTSVAVGSNKVYVPTKLLSKGMYVNSNILQENTRIEDVVASADGVGSILTLDKLSIGAGIAGAITATSRRVYSVKVDNAASVVDGMVARISDPTDLNGKINYAGVTVDRSSKEQRVLLDFTAFGDATGKLDDSTDAATGAVGDHNLTNGTNVDPKLDSFKGNFGVEFETNKNTDWYKPASLGHADVRISFDEAKQYSLSDINGNPLDSTLDLTKIRAEVPKVKSFTVGTSGDIVATLSNGQTFVTGKVCLQDFWDPGALVRQGDNLFDGMELAGEKNKTPWTNMTVDDTLAQFTPGHAGLGAIQGSALELSNVDIGEEFSQMITTQRSFQAGSRVITVSDQMLEEVVNLKR
ncbi:MAG: flagellar hook-basal body complex protein [Verrucomicrobiota bacterium]